jgi:predicted dehydrogenase
MNNRDDFLQSARTLDGMVVALETRSTSESLKSLSELPIPLLIEKPGALDPSELESLRNPWSLTKWMFAYNRRYYGGVLAMRTRVQELKICHATAVWPDLNGSEHQFIINGCHMIDLLRFIFGDLELRFTSGLSTQEQTFSGTFVLTSTSGGLRSVTLQVVPGVPANSSITTYGEGEVQELRPLERFVCYNSMEVSEPTRERPIRLYTPHQAHTDSELGLDGKPGFLQQAKSFRRLIETGELGPNDASLEQALDTLKLLRTMILKG